MKHSPSKQQKVLLGGVFAPEGTVVSLLDAFSDLVILNLLLVLTSLPVITAGASLSAAYRCSRKLRLGETHLASTFFRCWRQDFRRVTPVWLGMLALLALLLAERAAAAAMDAPTGAMFRCALTAALLLWLGLFVWLIPALDTLALNRRQTVRAAAALAVGSLPQTLLMMLVTLLPVLIVRLIPNAFGVVLLLGLLLLTEGTVLVNSILADHVWNRITTDRSHCHE